MDSTPTPFEEPKKPSRLSKFLENSHLYFPIVVAIGEIIAFIFLIDKGFGILHNPTAIAIFFILSSLLLIALFFLIFYYTKNQKAKKQISDLSLSLGKTARYTDIFADLNAAFIKVHQSGRSQHVKESDYIMALTVFCSHLEGAFTKITGKQCYVCIKMTWAEDSKPDDLEVMTICRDIKSTKNKRDGRDNELRHPIRENTDFYSIFKSIDDPGGRVFFGNELPKILGYSNTSFIKYGYPSSTPFPYHTKWQDKVAQWKLPYKSCIVAAICPPEEERKKEKGHKYLQGFLCVDSEEMGTFDEKVDKQIMIGCADGLYNTIKQFKEQFHVSKPS